jgi:beta-lactamase superfamily II metal-dependent hydrolase
MIFLMQKINFQRALRWLALGLEAQLFLTLCSLPILLAWGLPISLASLAGNFLFAPFLTLFLLSSSLLFFAQLFHLPDQLFILILEQCTDWWLWLLKKGSPDWLCELACPSTIILLAIITGTIAVLLFTRWNIYQRIAAFIAIFATVFIGILNWHRPANQFSVPTKGWHSVTIMHTPTHIALIDNGGLQRAGRSWARYTLKPLLIKKLGRSAIDYCITTAPHVQTLNNIASLSRTLKVKAIYLPAWQGNATATFWHALGSLKYACKKQKTELCPIATTPIELNWDEKTKLTIIPKQPLIKLDTIKVPTIAVGTAQLAASHELVQFLPSPTYQSSLV